MKAFFKSVVIYFLGSLGTKLITFFMLPVYTNCISPEGYGYFDLNTAYAVLFSTFFYMDIFSGIMKYSFEAQNKKEQKEVINTGFFIFAVSTLLYSVFMTLFGIRKHIDHLAYVILYGILYGLTNLYGYISRTLKYNLAYAQSGILNAFINSTVNLMLILACHMDYTSLYLSYSIAGMMQCLFLEIKTGLLRELGWKFIDKKIMVCLVKYSLPLSINSTCFWMLSSINKDMIARHLSVTQNGYYAVIQKFGNLLIAVMSCVAMAWQEVAFQRYGRDKETSDFYSRVTKGYIEVLMLIFVGILPGVYVLFPVLTGSSYWPAREFIPFYIMAVTINILSNHFGSIVNTYKKNFELMLSNIGACIIDYLFIRGLIVSVGLHAANAALIAGYSFSALFRFIIIRKVIVLKISLLTLTANILFCILSCYCFLRLDLWINILCCCSIYVLLIFKYHREIKRYIAAGFGKRRL